LLKIDISAIINCDIISVTPFILDDIKKIYAGPFCQKNPQYQDLIQCYKHFYDRNWHCVVISCSGYYVHAFMQCVGFLASLFCCKIIYIIGHWRLWIYDSNKMIDLCKCGQLPTIIWMLCIAKVFIYGWNLFLYLFVAYTICINPPLKMVLNLKIYMDLKFEKNWEMYTTTILANTLLITTLLKTLINATLQNVFIYLFFTLFVHWFEQFLPRTYLIKLFHSHNLQMFLTSPMETQLKLSVSLTTMVSLSIDVYRNFCLWTSPMENTAYVKCLRNNCG